ncbi:MAG: cytochrome P450 [Polyangiales bacterium]
MKRPPGPTPRRGLLETIVGFSTDPLGFVHGRFEKYGDMYYVPNRQGGFYVMRHPEHLQAVLVTHAAKMRKQHSAFELLSRVVGEGLLTTDGDVWRRQRRMLQPAFSRERLASYAKTMVDEAARVSDTWRDGQQLDVSRAMMELTLRVVCRTLFSHDVGTETDDVARAMVVLQDSVSSSSELLPEWLPTPHRRKFKKSVEAIDKIVYSMIAERKRTGHGDDLLQSLITAVDEEGGAGLSEREMRDQLVTLFLAGHETTSHALTWTWYLLSKNPAVMAKLHAELASLKGPPTLDDPLPYTEQVIKESMRLYPPVYLLARRNAEDVEIGGYTIPSGSEIVLWVYMTQRDARWFPDPESFRPERFSPENEAKLPKIAYAPFGAGPRACIGKQFAMIEARLLLATLARRHRLDLVPGHRVVPKPRVTLNPKFGMQMTAHAR